MDVDVTAVRVLCAKLAKMKSKYICFLPKEKTVFISLSKDFRRKIVDRFLSKVIIAIKSIAVHMHGDAFVC